MFCGRVLVTERTSEPSAPGAPIGVSNVTVTVGSANATVEFAGLVAVGEFQINIVVPNLPDGESLVTVQVAGKSSQAGVTIAIAH